VIWHTSRTPPGSLRHAFGKSGTVTVWVQFGRMPDGLLKLVVADDGKGITPRVEFSNTVGLGCISWR
jgi:two-component sensor histidine kinase